jgi:DNA-binding transcriptional MocR family regulator
MQLYKTGERPRTASALARTLEAAILDGRLEPDTKLPPIRAWAKDLELSPVTVGAAVKLLRNRGLLATDGRRGTRVIGVAPETVPINPPLPPGIRDLRSANPDPALLPDLNAALRAIDAPQVLYGEPAVLEALAVEAARRFSADGIAAEAEGITVTSGALDAIERSLRARTRAGDRVAIEDPHFIHMIHLVRSIGRVPEPVEVDARGVRPDALKAALAAGARAVLLSPRGQNPSGATFDAERADALRAVLRRHPDVLLIEDDHAHEVAGTPLYTLVDPDREAPWVAMRSVSKSLGMDLRLAVVTGDPLTIRRVQTAQLVGPGWTSLILQRLVAHLWTDPATAKLLERARRTYRERREALVAALAEHDIELQARSWWSAWLPVADEPGTLQALRDQGFGVAAGARYRLRPTPGIRISTATLRPEEAPAFAQALATALRPSTARTLAA